MLEVEIEKAVVFTTENNYCDFNNIQSIDHSTKYTDFLENFMLKNLPCIIKNVTITWECSENWIKHNQINYEYFEEKYGDLVAPVADCNALSFNAHCKKNMKVKEFMEYLKTNKKEKLLYLKDWHLRKLMPGENFYEVPMQFSSDWLNEFATDCDEDDFMFVYIGPQDSWTPLHVDVYNSYSWSVNVIGKKKWIFFPPGEEEKIKDLLGNLPQLFDSKIFPNVKYFETIQEQGDALFVPSGWHHQVVNLQDTISVNHNWINACNLETIWSALQKCLFSIEKEIQEFKEDPDFAPQCQLMLKSLFGMDLSEFVIFVSHIGKKRISQLRGEVKRGFRNFKLGINHIKFDLKILNKVMDLIHNNYLFSVKCLSLDVQKDFLNTKNIISEYIRN